MRKPKKRPSAGFHAFIFLFGIGLSIALAKLGVFEYVINLSKSHLIIGAFLVGIFFTALLTTPIAAVAFYDLAQAGSPVFVIALFGGLGAVVGDLLIFRFLEYGMGDEITLFLKQHVRGFKRLVRYRAFSITLIFLGALIVMSPLPVNKWR